MILLLSFQVYWIMDIFVVYFIGASSALVLFCFLVEFILEEMYEVIIDIIGILNKTIIKKQYKK